MLWAEANILLVSSLRDGLCLPPVEFVAAKKLTNKPPGLLFLSEFAGVNKSMNGYLEFNPFDSTEFLTKLDQALSLSPKDLADLSTQSQPFL